VLGTWGDEGLTIERISIFDEVLLASEESASVVAKIADPETHIVTLTITEKGYHLKPEDNRLDLSEQTIKYDLARSQSKSVNLKSIYSETAQSETTQSETAQSETAQSERSQLNTTQLKTAIGMLAAGLVRRCHETGQSLTVISCDNLSDNGRKLSQAMVDYITELEPDVLPWILDNVSFPNSMIDRITPKLSNSALKEINEVADVSGISAVGTEAFSEWIIENTFKAQRPNWDLVGAVLVSDVRSYEERKLRLLNASHSYLAYAGLLAGHTFVHEAIADAKLKSNVNAIWDEAERTVSEPASTTLQEYRSALLDRFAVVQMRHSLEQIATDGSLKLRERIVPILQKRQLAGLASPMILQAISVWAKFVQTRVSNGEQLNDPNVEQLSKIVTQHPSDAIERLIEMVLENTEG